MDQILLGLGAAGAALLVIAIAVALWEHRRHLAEMRQQLVWSENARDLLQAHAKDVDARMATLAAAVNAQLPTAAAPARPAQPAWSSDGTPTTTTTATRTTAHAGSAAVAMAAAQAAVTQHWIDTEPMVLTSQVLAGPAPDRDEPDRDVHDRDVPDFDPTMPAELSEH